MGKSDIQASKHRRKLTAGFPAANRRILTRRMSIPTDSNYFYVVLDIN